MVDIKFDTKNASEKQLFSTKFIHQFLRKKVLPANERSVFQLLDAMRLNDKETINSFKTKAKTHAAMDEKL